jgi:ABC-type phosphate/phosphonate transport system substrate-binding protein
VRVKRLKNMLALVAALGTGVAAAATDQQLVVFSSPGSPGTTADAQPRMDAFAAAVSAKVGMPITAVYDPSDAGGVEKMANAGVAIVSLPFFLKHEKELGLHARLQVVQEGHAALERWALVAQKGRVKDAQSVAGFTIVSSASFAPGFVRGSALGGFGKLPADVTIAPATAILSSLKRAAAGEPIALLLDAAQRASLASLPFGSQLEVVAESPPLPVAIVATVDRRMPAKTWTPIEAALLASGSDSSASAALTDIQVARFTAIDDAALAAARKGYRGAP